MIKGACFVCESLKYVCLEISPMTDSESKNDNMATYVRSDGVRSWQTVEDPIGLR